MGITFFCLMDSIEKCRSIYSIGILVLSIVQVTGQKMPGAVNIQVAGDSRFLRRKLVKS